MYKHILVPTDGSPLSLKAAKEAAALAKTLKAKITAVYVTEPWIPPVVYEGMMLGRMDELQSEYRKASQAEAAKALGKIEAAVASAKVVCEGVHVIDNRPWEAIIKAAKSRKCDLIVMASHGRKGIAGLLLGSVTVKVLTHSKTPVLVCR